MASPIAKLLFNLAWAVSRTGTLQRYLDYLWSHPLNIFLSHSNIDKDAVRALYDRLKADKLNPWLDEREIRPGHVWEAKIRTAINEADVALICLSARSYSYGKYFQREVEIILDVAKTRPTDSVYVIPVLLEQCSPPERIMRKWHAANLYEENGYQQLLGVLVERAKEVHK